MEFETYADVIDAYNANNMGYSTLTDYIKDQNIKIKEIEMEPLADLQRSLFENKADGGSVGIEVLFGPKVPAAPSQLVSESDILLGYRGDAAYRSASEQSKSIGQGNVGSKASFGGGKGVDRSGRDEGASGAQVSQALEAQRLRNIANQNKKNSMINTAKNVYGFVSPFINPGSTLGKVKSVFDVYNMYKNSPINEKDVIFGNEKDLIFGMGDQTLPSDNLLAFEPGSKKDKQLKSLFKEKGLTEDLGIPFPGKKEKKLQELMKEDQEQTDFPKTELLRAKDGGRVGLFMGGPALEGQALSIYDSMKSYGASDQAIADRLSSMGLYGGSTPDEPTTVQPIGYQGRGDDNPYAGQVVDQTDYSFNKKNYGPGQKLEINPAAVGMSFYDSTTGTSTPNKTVKEDKGIIGRTIDSFMGAAIPEKQLSQFTSPTTGGTLTGPAELGFMTKNIEGIPGNLTRDDLRSMYDNYNKFFGRSSNFANARIKGPVSDLVNLIPVVGSAARMFGSGGDKSLQSKYTVDGAGFGNTGMRDEFGLGTFDAKDGFLGLTGNTTRTYVNRMEDKLEDLDDFFGSRIEGFDINNLDAATLNKMSKINSFYTKQIQAYKQRLAVEDINKRTQDAIEAEKERQKQIELQKKIEAEAAAGKSMSEIGRENFTGEGMAFAPRKDTFTGGKTVTLASGKKYSSPRKDGGLMFADGGLATMFTRRR
jgi:hypothetical protein